MERLTERYIPNDEKKGIAGIKVFESENKIPLVKILSGEYLYPAIEKLATYEDLEEQGLLFKLPCKEVYSKSGDEVYLIFEDEIIECIHCGLDICGSDGEGYIILGAYEDIFPYRDPDPEHDLDPTDWCRNTNHVSLSEIGKTLFFTREKAENKLEEMKNE
jgi:hypothetical protein